jgi:hypothetical protein
MNFKMSAVHSPFAVTLIYFRSDKSIRSAITRQSMTEAVI